MGIDSSDFVYFDGSYIEERKLLNMAKNAGSYQIAEHYVCSLLYHAVMHKKDYLAEEVNKIRKYYTLPPFPTPNASPASSQNMPEFVKKKNDTNDVARLKYKKLSEEERIDLVKKCLILLLLRNKSLFEKKTCWIGIFLVIRDRLMKISQKDFVDFAQKCTPHDWNDNIRIGASTMSNLGRYISYDDRDEAYYDMTNNPFEDLCELFWSIILNELLTAD